MIRTLLAASLVVSCVPPAMPLTPPHPAHPAAPTGRLAGPPAALRPGVVELAPAPKQAPPPHGHEGHH